MGDLASPRRKSLGPRGSPGLLARRQEHAPQGHHKHPHARGALAVPPIKTNSSFLLNSRVGSTPQSLRKMDTQGRRRVMLRTPTDKARDQGGLPTGSMVHALCAGCHVAACPRR